MIFLSSQASLSSKKRWRIWRKKRESCHDYWKNVSRFRVLKNHAFDIGENVSQWQKRDTIMETLIWMVCYTRQKRVTIYLNRATILWAVVAYLSWRLFWKQGLRVGESQVRFWDLKTARRANSSTFYQFMYVLIPLLIMLFVNSIMSS